MKNKFLLPRFKSMMSEGSWLKVKKGIILGVIAGLLMGIGLVLLLPISTSLITGKPCWGLDFKSWLLVLLFLAIITTVVDYFGTATNYRGGLGFMKDVYILLGDKISRLPLGWFNSNTSGVMSRLVSQEMVNLSSCVANFIYNLVRAISQSIAIVLGAFVWEPRLGVILILSVPIVTFLFNLSRSFNEKGKKISEPAEEELASRIVEFSLCQGAIRSCGKGDGYKELDDAFEDAYFYGRKGLKIETIGMLVSGVVIRMVIVLMLSVITYLALSGKFSPLSTITTLGIALRFSSMLDEISSNMMGLEERRIMMDKLDYVMNTNEIPVVEKSESFTNLGEVFMKGVSFSYDKNKTILKDISFEIKPGKMLALVGPSGSGKTTIARLIARFYDVDKGKVKVSGVNVKDLTTQDLMGQLSMVFQDVYLFDDTLLNNIKIGKENASMEEIKWAADMSGTTEIATRLPMGLETQVGEGGRSISGGERQRVSIARALLKKAPIVLFDEATSALDARNENHIVESMEQLRKNSTLLVIAHKLETIQNADEILVLNKNGFIEQRGKHDDLIKYDGPYKKFWSYRKDAQNWKLV